MGKWVALYSQTGSELFQVCEQLRKFPDRVFTNNPNTNKIGSRFATHRDIMTWLRNHLEPGDVVTLHGYLRIIPADILEMGARFYNGHPGFVPAYPELKGLNPQEKVLANPEKYNMVGCVVHEVTEDVDGGKVLLARAERWLKDEELYAKLHAISVTLWVDFLREVFREQIT